MKQHPHIHDHVATEEFDAGEFFSFLTENNLLCREYGFRFVTVSDIEGFGEALDTMQDYTPLIALSDTSAGQVSIYGAPVTRRVKTLFMFMPHPVNDADAMAGRARCFAVMREIARQFLSVLLLERTRFQHCGLVFSKEVAFEEIDRYFFSGGACSYLQIAVDMPTDLTLKQDQWLQDPTRSSGTHERSMPRHSSET